MQEFPVRLRSAASSAFLLFALLMSANAAATPVIDFTGGQVAPNLNNETYGYAFAVSGPGITVSGLGMFDSYSLPVQFSHAVGIWDSNGTLLASTTITPSASTTASTDSLGQWLDVNISSLFLPAGTYYAGVFYQAGSEDVLLAAVPQSSDPFVTYLSSQYSFGSSLSLPSSSFGASTLVGPAIFTSATTPEPSSLALLGTGFLGLIGVARRRFVA